MQYSLRIFSLIIAGCAYASISHAQDSTSNPLLNNNNFNQGQVQNVQDSMVNSSIDNLTDTIPAGTDSGMVNSLNPDLLNIYNQKVAKKIYNRRD